MKKIADTVPEKAVRERLVIAAAKLFAVKGYAATTVREIVAAAGVTKPALYYYFHNKAGIYLELMSGALAKFEALLDSSRDERAKASAKLCRLCDGLMVLLQENIPVAKVMYSVYYGPPQGAPFFDCEVFHFKLQDAVGRLIEEGIARREFRRKNVTDMTWAVLGAVNISIELELSHPEISPGRNGLERVMAVIFDGLRTKVGK